MKTLRTFAAVSMLSICAAPFAAGAADVTFAPPVTISGDADVSTLGTLVDAYSFRATTSPAIAVNGVDFQPYVVTANPTSVGNYSLYETLGTPTSGIVSTDSGYGTAAAPFSALSPSYKSLLSAGAQSFFVIETLQLTMNNLTPGRQYQVQLWANFSSPSFFADLLQPGSQNAQGGSGNLIIMDQNTALLNADGGLGQYALGTFIADGTSQMIQLNGVDTVPMLNAFQLREVPEPASLGLLAGCGMMLSRRRR